VLETIQNDQQNERPWLFKPGNSASPGRPKGSKSKLATNFVDALYEDFQKNGAEAIVKCRETNVTGYLNVIVKIIPQDVTVTHKTVFDEMSADDLLRLVNAVASDAARPVDGSTTRVIEAEAGTVPTVSEAEIIP
jgi:hypothetical protein